MFLLPKAAAFNESQMPQDQFLHLMTDYVAVAVDYLARASGPPALLVAIIALVKQIREVKNLRLRNKKIIDDLITARLSREKISAETDKLKAEVKSLEASAISNEIVARREQLNTEEIIKCLDAIDPLAKSIYEDICKAYKIFQESTISRSALKMAYPAIKEFIDGREHRYDFDRHYNQLRELLRPSNHPHAGGPLHGTIGEKLFEVVAKFSGDVFLSRPKIESLRIPESDYKLTVDQIDDIRNWMNVVRRDVDELSAILGKVAAQVQVRTSMGY